MNIRLAVLGDSIAWGQGASRERDRLAPRLAEGLERSGYDVIADSLLPAVTEAARGVATAS